MTVILFGLILIVLLGFIVMKKPSFWIGSVLTASLLCLTVIVLLRVTLVALKSVATQQSVLIGLILFGILILSFVFIAFAIGIYFIHNTSVVFTKEGRSFTGWLSSLFGINLLILIPLFWVLFRTTFIPLKIVLGIFLGEDLFFTFLFLAYTVYSALNQMLKRPHPADYLIVLGSWSGRNGEIPPLLKSRVDAAIEYNNKIGSTAKFIVTGAQGPDEERSEAVAMAEYLYSQGITKASVLLENKARTTLENMLFSKEIIEKDWKYNTIPIIAFSTNNYHVLRALIYAKKVNLNAIGIGAPTSFYFLPSALLREFIALLAFYKKITVSLMFMTAVIATILLLV